ncbi:MAG: PhnD/SsuA/transferrin family substrate-binding protein [Caldilineales bacterium]|nr:PhnD/SsuA/transferrin family substrate-binding protein [Caldilineales bacterium]
MPLTLTSCQAPEADSFWQALADHLSRQMERPIVFVSDPPWQERVQALADGAVDIGWICGSYYVKFMARPEPGIELLAAPVMAGARYDDRPVYFSDVVVRADSPWRRFEDLRGVVWAVNEPGSHSGYGAVALHLKRLGLDWTYFGRVVVSGAHRRSLELILAGEVDASAIDSTVLEEALRREPELAERIRVITAIGPNPIPPLIVQTRLPAGLRAELRQRLLTLHHDPIGRDLLALAHMARFAQVRDEDYDPLRPVWVR